MSVKERLNFKEPNGRKFSKTATGADADAATAYAAAIAAITVGTLVNATVTSDVATGDLPATHLASTYSDATFHFRKGLENVNVHFEQLSNAFAEVIDGSSTGNINIDDSPILDYAAAWSDANGGGWSLIQGHYVK